MSLVFLSFFEKKYATHYRLFSDVYVSKFSTRKKVVWGRYGAPGTLSQQNGTGTTTIVCFFGLLIRFFSD
jgi:hypothetical protein